MTAKHALQLLTDATNRETYDFLRYRNSCILSSRVLVHVIAALGLRAKPVRVQVALFHSSDPKAVGCLMGDSNGTRLPAAAYNRWNGHLAVLVEGRYLLDPTIDQATQAKKPEHQWISGLLSFVGEVTQDWLDGKALLFRNGNAKVRYRLAPRQGGFKDAGDWKYQSHWGPVARRVLMSDEALAVLKSL
jgi:hypothetical protein